MVGGALLVRLRGLAEPNIWCGPVSSAARRLRLVCHTGLCPASLGTEIPFAHSFHDWAETEEVVRKVEVTVGVALGKIAEAQPPLTVREACEGGGSGLWGVRGKLVFGSVWQGRKWERLGERNSFCM